MNKADIINSDDAGKHVFTQAELDGCRDKGECCMCGMCCIAFENSVPVQDPATVPKQSLTTIELKQMEPCHHLQETRDGLFACGIDISKDDCPQLDTCRLWKGNDVRKQPMIQSFGDHQRITYNAYAQMAWLFGEAVTGPKATPEDIAVANKLITRGIVRWPLLKLEIAKEKKFHSILSLCLRLESLPYEFLDNIKVRDFFAKMSPDQALQFLISLGIDLQNPTPVQEEFLGYVGCG